jgi:hypothetical protein
LGFSVFWKYMHHPSLLAICGYRAAVTHALTRPLSCRFPEAPPDIVSVTLNSSKKRTAYDTCVYVTSPSDRTKRMIVVTPHDTWETFVNKVRGDLLSRAYEGWN